MGDAKIRKTRAEVLQEIEAAHERTNALAAKLLENINQHKTEIQQLLTFFCNEEPDLVYRFYHQSFKVFGMINLIVRANDLFERLAPDSIPLNAWYLSITKVSISKKFNPAETNQKWLEETLPITQGFWHAKYFLEHMIVAADEIESAPQILPSGWAAVLYLYNLR